MFYVYELWLSYFSVAESWEHHPIGILEGNKYHFGIYDECVNVHYPIKGKYCLSEIKLTSLSKKYYSYNRTEDLDNFENNHAWHTILGVSLNLKLSIQIIIIQNV